RWQGPSASSRRQPATPSHLASLPDPTATSGSPSLTSTGSDGSRQVGRSPSSAPQHPTPAHLALPQGPMATSGSPKAWAARSGRSGPGAYGRAQGRTREPRDRPTDRPRTRGLPLKRVLLDGGASCRIVVCVAALSHAKELGIDAGQADRLRGSNRQEP